jgi:hypothetical protein
MLGFGKAFYVIELKLPRVSLVEQELHTLPKHMSSHPVLVGFVLLDLKFYV